MDTLITKTRPVKVRQLFSETGSLSNPGNPSFGAEIRAVGALSRDGILSYILPTGWNARRNPHHRDATRSPGPIRSPSLLFLEKTTFPFLNFEIQEKSGFVTWHNQKIDFSVLQFWSILTPPPQKGYLFVPVNSPETGFCETRREKPKFEIFGFLNLQYLKFKNVTIFGEKNVSFSRIERVDGAVAPQLGQASR